MASIKIKLTNPRATAARLNNLVKQKAMPIVAEQILTDCNEFVRMQSGALAASGHPEANGSRIVWDTRYAKRVYYTGTPRTNVNPQASLRWCEKAKRQYSQDWADMISSIVGGG